LLVNELKSLGLNVELNLREKESKDE